MLTNFTYSEVHVIETWNSKVANKTYLCEGFCSLIAHIYFYKWALLMGDWMLNNTYISLRVGTVEGGCQGYSFVLGALEYV